jgi:hypothetical protein
MRNPYVVRNVTHNSLNMTRNSLNMTRNSLNMTRNWRSTLRINSKWEDMLNADVRRTILSHADRRVEYEESGSQALPAELVPAKNFALYNATRQANHNPAEKGPPDFDIDTTQTRVFARERHGILGPLTVSFSDCVDRQWWGFKSDGDGEHGTLALSQENQELIRAALDYNAEWTGITKIRLPLERYVNSAEEHHRLYRYEFVREAQNGHQHTVITPPADLFYIHASFSTDAQPPAEKTQLA